MRGERTSSAGGDVFYAISAKQPLHHRGMRSRNPQNVARRMSRSRCCPAKGLAGLLWGEAENAVAVGSVAGDGASCAAGPRPMGLKPPGCTPMPLRGGRNALLSRNRRKYVALISRALAAPRVSRLLVKRGPETGLSQYLGLTRGLSRLADSPQIPNPSPRAPHASSLTPHACSHRLAGVSAARRSMASCFNRPVSRRATI